MELQIFLGILVILALLHLIISRRNHSMNMFNNMNVPPAKPLGISSTRNLSDDQIVELARTNKIEAIKIYREKTGLGLKEAMDAVDKMLAGEGVQDLGSQIMFEPLDEAKLSRMIEPYLAQNKLIDAIKVVREKTHWGLLESKEWVEKQNKKN